MVQSVEPQPEANLVGEHENSEVDMGGTVGEQGLVLTLQYAYKIQCIPSRMAR